MKRVFSRISNVALTRREGESIVITGPAIVRLSRVRSGRKAILVVIASGETGVYRAELLTRMLGSSSLSASDARACGDPRHRPA